MSEDDNVLFVRGNGNESCDDIWDDSALIKAYDKAISLAKEEVSKRIGVESLESSVKPKKLLGSKQTHNTNKSKKKWCLGAPCQAVYSGDGEVYEAVITKIFENSGTCVVKFIGYNNTEKVELSSLIESDGLQSQIAQQKEAAAAAADPSTSSMECENSQKVNGYQENSMECETEEVRSFKNIYMPGLSLNHNFGAMPPAPPLPPQLMARLPENDADALSSMLMSWYMSGFHTGYYHGLKQAQNNQGQRKT